MGGVYLDELLASVSGAVAEARTALEAEQTKQYLQYFEPTAEGHLDPKVVSVLLPREHLGEGQDAVGSHEIPMVSLTETKQVQLQDVSLEMDCVVEDVEGSAVRPRLRLRLPGRGVEEGPPARLTIRFATGEVPEASARINDRLLKSF